MTRLSLNDIFEEDDTLGLLNVKTPNVPALTVDEKIRDNFEEINVFIDRHGYVPGEGTGAGSVINARKLKIRLEQIRGNPEIRAQLLPLDKHNLLSSEETMPESLDDIFDLDDPLLSALPMIYLPSNMPDLHRRYRIRFRNVKNVRISHFSNPFWTNAQMI